MLHWCSCQLQSWATQNALYLLINSLPLKSLPGITFEVLFSTESFEQKKKDWVCTLEKSRNYGRQTTTLLIHINKDVKARHYWYKFHLYGKKSSNKHRLYPV